MYVPEIIINITFYVIAAPVVLLIILGLYYGLFRFVAHMAQARFGLYVWQTLMCMAFLDDTPKNWMGWRFRAIISMASKQDCEELQHYIDKRVYELDRG